MADVIYKEIRKNHKLTRDDVCDKALLMNTPLQPERLERIENGKFPITPDEVMLEGKTASQLYKTNIINEETDFSEEYIYVFTFVEGYCIIAAMPLAEAMLMRDASLYTSIFMLILIFAALFIFIYFLIKNTESSLS